MVATPADRRAAAGIISGVIPPTVTPGLNMATIRQVAGWGYTINVNAVATGQLTCNRTAVLQTGVLPVTVPPGLDPTAFRQTAGWGTCRQPLFEPGPPLNCERTAVLQTGVLPVTVGPALGPVAFRQTAGWGYCRIPVGVTATATGVEFRPFVYRRRMQRLRSRKRFLK